MSAQTNTIKFCLSDALTVVFLISLVFITDLQLLLEACQWCMMGTRHRAVKIRITQRVFTWTPLMSIDWKIKNSKKATEQRGNTGNAYTHKCLVVTVRRERAFVPWLPVSQHVLMVQTAQLTSSRNGTMMQKQDQGNKVNLICCQGMTRTLRCNVMTGLCNHTQARKL